MNFKEFTTFINQSLESRFSFEEPNKYSREIESLASENLLEKKVFRFYRKHSSNERNEYCKTLLMAGIKESNTLKDVLEWTALSKDLLLDPETSDIYLFIFWDGENKPSLEKCLQIEATEDFCRKFVLRPDEDEISFIDRTFIRKLDKSIPVDLGADPLLSTFSEIGNQFSWFDEKEQKKWQLAFSSGLAGNDLFISLMNDNIELK
jgi:hypothetical protein